MIPIYHHFILKTEAVIKSIETSMNIALATHEWTMWLPQENFRTSFDNALELVEVDSEEKWQKMLEIRIDIEKEFGITDQNKIKQLVDDIRVKSHKLNGKWFLASIENKIVGEVGIIPFDFNGERVGRLQDVDIIPSEQNKGLGTQLLNEICKKALLMKLSALCLMAKSDDWPKDWYMRFGFLKAGEV